MYLINTTFHVNTSKYDIALDEVISHLIPAACQSGLFSEPLVTEIMVPLGEDVRSFAVQFRADDHDKAIEWLNGSDSLGNIASKIGREAIVWFTTPMQIINHDGRKG